MAERKTISDLLGFYEEILNDLNVVIQPDNTLVANYNGHINELKIGGKELVFPTNDVLKDAPWDTHVAFHPLSEMIMLGESNMIKTLRTLITTKVDHTIHTLAQGILELGADTDKHRDLASSQVEFLTRIGDVDQKTVDVYKSIIKLSRKRSSHAMIKLYIKRDSTLNEEEHKRVCNVSFPIVKELFNGVNEIFGVKMRKKDKSAIENLLLELIPSIRQPHAYSKGSSSNVAPYFHVLLRTMHGLMTELNSTSHLFRRFFKGPTGTLWVPMRWYEDIDNIKMFSDMIPPMEENRGWKSPESESTDTTVSDQVNEANSVKPRPIKQIAASESKDIATPEPTGYQQPQVSALPMDHEKPEEPTRNLPRLMGTRGVAAPGSPPTTNYQQPAPRSTGSEMMHEWDRSVNAYQTRRNEPLTPRESYDQRMQQQRGYYPQQNGYYPQQQQYAPQYQTYPVHHQPQPQQRGRYNGPSFEHVKSNHAAHPAAMDYHPSNIIV